MSTVVRSRQHHKSVRLSNHDFSTDVVDDRSHSHATPKRPRFTLKCCGTMAMVVALSLMMVTFVLFKNVHSINPWTFRRTMLWQWKLLNDWKHRGTEQWWLIPDDALPNCTRYQSPNYIMPSDTASNWTDFNLIYIKAFKVGGSTVSGVVRAIGHKHKMDGTFRGEWASTEPRFVSSCSMICSILKF